MTETPLNTVLKNSVQAILVLDDSWNILYASDHIRGIFGYSRKELIEKNFFQTLYPGTARVYRENKQQLKREMAGKNLALKFVIHLKHKRGHSFLSAVTVTNLLHDKYINGIVITIKNITKEKKVEEQRIAQLLIQAEERERRALAGELHDNINQLIAISVFLIDSYIARQKDENELLSESSKNLKSALAEIRKLAFRLTNYDLHKFGLHSSVKNFIYKVLLELKISIVVRIDKNAEILMNDNQKLHIFRIIQELVNNILKHAAASKVFISLSKVSAGFVLKIRDNGVGFDVNKPANGIGISNITQRATALGGHFDISSKKAVGTIAIIKIPV